MEPAFVFLDFEFTTYERNQAPKGFFHEVIEIGLIKVQENTIVENYSSLVAASHFPELSEKTIELTGIRQVDVDRGMSFKDMVNSLKSFYIPKETTLVTWGDMDVMALRRNCRESKVPFPLSLMLEDWLDLSKAHQHYYGHSNTPGLWAALTACGKADRPQTHRALDDAIATYHIYQKMVEDQWRYDNPHEKDKLNSSIADLLDSELLIKMRNVLSTG